jgi:N-acetylglucosamine malate deacetylase 1
MNILIFAPHPDDDILGCGGSIVKRIQNGDHVTVVYITSGDAGDQTTPKEELANIREKEALDAATVLGVKDLIFFRQPDGYIRYSKELLTRMVNIIREKTPDMVYMPHELDFPSDHKEASQLILEALRRSGASAHQEYTGAPWSVSTVLGYEVWTPISNPSYTEDISGVMSQKLEAMKKHASQLTNVRYDQAIEGLNAYRGVLSEKGKYCECFTVIRLKEVK